jgi:hypothetical protein
MSKVKIEQWKNPANNPIALNGKSIVIGRITKEKTAEFKTLSIKLFDVNDPHLTTEFPIKELLYTNTEKVELIDLDVTYYLEGSDMVINDLESAEVHKTGNSIRIKGFQKK